MLPAKTELPNQQKSKTTGDELKCSQKVKVIYLVICILPGP